MLRFVEADGWFSLETGPWMGSFEEVDSDAASVDHEMLQSCLGGFTIPTEEEAFTRAQAVFAAITDADPNATWVYQGMPWSLSCSARFALRHSTVTNAHCNIDCYCTVSFGPSAKVIRGFGFIPKEAAATRLLSENSFGASRGPFLKTGCWYDVLLWACVPVYLTGCSLQLVHNFTFSVAPTL